jgi:tRNA (cmo5U34)-methyltransferase
MCRVEFHFDPDTYLGLMRRELLVYDEIQRKVAQAAAGGTVRRILDLGAGTGETSRAVLEQHPTASLVLLDENPGMLAVAMNALGDERIEQTVVGDLLGPLPDGPFDLIVSALAIHHVEGAAKHELFVRIRGLLHEGGRFVMADLVVPGDPAEAVTPLSEGYDHPSSLQELDGWLDDAGFGVSVVWGWKDIVVLSCSPRADANDSPF